MEGNLYVVSDSDSGSDDDCPVPVPVPVPVPEEPPVTDQHQDLSGTEPAQDMLDMSESIPCHVCKGPSEDGMMPYSNQDLEHVERGSVCTPEDHRGHGATFQ